MGELLESDRWLGVTFKARSLSQHRVAEKDPLQVMKEGQSLLLAGTSEGHMTVLASENGKVQFNVPGHAGPVVIIAPNPKKQRVISAGLGKVGGGATLLVR